MNRPLVVSDCDEVLLHMVAPFRTWLSEAHGITFDMTRSDFGAALRRGDGTTLESAEVWELLGGFFDGQMHRQTPIVGAVNAMRALAHHADVVILTNLQDHRQQTRTRQLADHGITARVFTNQGPKGPALQAIIAQYGPSHTIFIDDLPQHHGSVAQLAPTVTRLHFCGEPALAPHIACAHRAGHAHARIDDWASAVPWLLARLDGVPLLEDAR